MKIQDEMMENFDFSRFISGNEMLMENLNIENCRISGIKSEFLRIVNCNFKNVVFETSFCEQYITVRNCEFKDCIFKDTFEGDDLELSIGDSAFSDCLFEDVSYQSWQVQSNITNCKLTNCDFKNIHIEGDICFVGLEMTGGKIENFKFSGNQILQNDFSNIHMSDVNVNCSLIKNKMEKCDFKNVTLEGYNKDNTYIECVN